MQKKYYSYLLACVAVLICSCKDDPITTYGGCCGNEPLNESFGNTHVYVANIFTPNNDGINDLFHIAADSLKRIVLLDIKNRAGITVLHQANLLYDNFYQSWDGSVDGNIVKGLYSYTLTLEAIDGTIKTFEGEVCNYPCDFQGTEEKISPDHCTFASQTNINGSYDPTIPSGEQNGCFE